MMVAQSWCYTMNGQKYTEKIVEDIEAWVVAATMVLTEVPFDLELAEAMMSEFVELRVIFRQWQGNSQVVDIDAKNRRVTKKQPEG